MVKQHFAKRPIKHEDSPTAVLVEQHASRGSPKRSDLTRRLQWFVMQLHSTPDDIIAKCVYFSSSIKLCVALDFKFKSTNTKL